MAVQRTLLSLGHGYSAAALAARLLPEGWRVIGTTRSPDKADRMAAAGVEPVLWPPDDPGALLADARHILISAAPGADGCPVLAEMQAAVARVSGRIVWAGYLSTTGVYGDRQGGWVDETAPCRPATQRGHWRVAAEQGWAAVPGLALHVFRLAGIYGPGRGPFAKVRAGTARRIVKPGQVFSRIHVEDIAAVLAASIAAPGQGPWPEIYNVCDDLPAPPEDVIAHAATLLGLPVPPEVDFGTAELSPMARSFYSESKRVSNGRLARDLGVQLAYPTYREGLKALLDAEDG